jgi:ketosteroid isomerase-like protein
MKKIIPILLLLIACNAKQEDLSKQSATEIIQADKDMSDLALKEGFHKALLAYADDSVVKPQEGQLPVKKYWDAQPDTKDISWEPYKAEAAKSGDWGYSLGNWKFTTKDTVRYGNYYTIWKKQADGKWKFTVDGGNNTPAPSK